MVGGHCLVIVPLGPLELLIGGPELLLVEGLGGAHPGDGRLQLAVDARHGLLLPHGRLHHAPALDDGEAHKDGHHGEHDKGQLPLDAHHHAKRAGQGDGGDEQVLRAVVGKLGDLEQVGGGPAHQLAGAVFIVEGKGQVLHMAEQVPADIRLNAHPHHVAPVGDDEIHHRAQGVGRQEDGHDGKKGGVQVLGQQLVERLAGGGGKSQIHQGDPQGAAHIQNKQLHMGLIIGQEDGDVAPLEALGMHRRDTPLNSHVSPAAPHGPRRQPVSRAMTASGSITLTLPPEEGWTACTVSLMSSINSAGVMSGLAWQHRA